MFGLGMPEILLILALALIIIGPKKLPDLAKTLGKSMREFKGAAQDFKNSIDMETAIGDIDPPADEIQKNIKDANKELADKEKNNKKSDDTISDNADTDNTDFDYTRYTDPEPNDAIEDNDDKLSKADSNKILKKEGDSNKSEQDPNGDTSKS
ncbi:MAG: preprotein translocase subunit TatB [Desulfobacteraceae bacterium]|nr:preprotein translocase subunit TatB [Desulfobacteraceae bacterium]